MWDTANQYVGTCDNSGLLPFLLFLAILVYGFKYLGRARRAAAKDKKTALFIWALGAALFANVVAFFGISYFDQTIVAWYGLLAIISAAVALPHKKEAVQLERQPAWDSAMTPLQLVPDAIGDGRPSEEMF
jgi:O-antigen ligase